MIGDFQKKVVLDEFPFWGDTTEVVPMRREKPLFVRFGHFQSETGETSLNHNTGIYEKGISVYPARLSEDEYVFIEPVWMSEVERCWYGIYRDRVQYVLTGRVCGQGSDGEPLLQPSSITVRGVLSREYEVGLRCVVGFKTSWQD